MSFKSSMCFKTYNMKKWYFPKKSKFWASYSDMGIIILIKWCFELLSHTWNFPFKRVKQTNICSMYNHFILLIERKIMQVLMVGCFRLKKSYKIVLAAKKNHKNFNSLYIYHLLPLRCTLKYYSWYNSWT